jgi:hypothetical protein
MPRLSGSTNSKYPSPDTMINTFSTNDPAIPLESLLKMHKNRWLIEEVLWFFKSELRLEN